MIEPLTLVDEAVNVPGTSVIAPGGRLYNKGAAWPNPTCPCFWAASAMIPENIGQATLVPPTTPTTRSPLLRSVVMISTPVNGSATIAISGTWRVLPGRPACHEGLAK